MRRVEEARVLIVDDEPQLLVLVEEILRADGFSCLAAAQDCAGALREVGRGRPDAVLLDVSLPDGDGFSLLKQLQGEGQTPVLFLTALGEDDMRLKGLGLGADDYITKPFLPRELTLRLRAVLRRTYQQEGPRAEKPVIHLGPVQVDMNSGQVSGAGREHTLTCKEYQLLMKLYENRGHIVTLDGLCRALWDDELYAYENTLMVHVRRLREKVELNPSQPRYLLTVRGLGYRLRLEAES